jgi:hypothetical protein
MGDRARRHHRLLSLLSLGLLALVAELVGRSLSTRIDVGRHVSTSYAGASYYPALLIAVKAGCALLLARLAWRFARARAAERAARRLTAALGVRPERRAPRMRIELSARLWLAFFLVTAGFYLVQTDAERLAEGRWPLLAPWLHTSALPVFAVLAVVVAVIYRAVAAWLTDYELYARESAELARSLALAVEDCPPRHASAADATPRHLFGLAFESRPPPAPA